MIRTVLSAVLVGSLLFVQPTCPMQNKKVVMLAAATGLSLIGGLVCLGSRYFAAPVSVTPSITPEKETPKQPVKQTPKREQIVTTCQEPKREEIVVSETIVTPIKKPFKLGKEIEAAIYANKLAEIEMILRQAHEDGQLAQVLDNVYVTDVRKNTYCADSIKGILNYWGKKVGNKKFEVTKQDDN